MLKDQEDESSPFRNIPKRRQNNAINQSISDMDVASFIASSEADYALK